MQITTKGRSAITALVDLATNDSNAPVTLKGISDRRNISVSYLEHLFGNLRRHNIVKSVRGPGGGYHLAAPATTISIAQIIMAVDDRKETSKSEGKNYRKNVLMCNPDSFWNGLDDVMYSYLSTVNLQQLMEDLHDQDEAEAIPATKGKRATKESPSLVSPVAI